VSQCSLFLLCVFMMLTTTDCDIVGI